MSTDDRIEELLERVAVLEEKLDTQRCCTLALDEKRIVDLVVSLVGERVEQALQPFAEAQRQEAVGGAAFFDEKRVVDLIVGLVGERMREIVRDEIGCARSRGYERSGPEHYEPGYDDREPHEHRNHGHHGHEGHGHHGQGHHEHGHHHHGHQDHSHHHHGHHGNDCCGPGRGGPPR